MILLYSKHKPRATRSGVRSPPQLNSRRKYIIFPWTTASFLSEVWDPANEARLGYRILWPGLVVIWIFGHIIGLEQDPTDDTCTTIAYLVLWFGRCIYQWLSSHELWALFKSDISQSTKTRLKTRSSCNYLRSVRLQLMKHWMLKPSWWILSARCNACRSWSRSLNWKVMMFSAFKIFPSSRRVRWDMIESMK